ncbi:MAG: glycerol-3-phosphate 1-O-acyltransferase PlsY [Campylobacterales bacterium]
MEFLANPNGQAYLIAYLIGSIPFGWIAIKVLAKEDLRKIGSGGTGATNVYRALQAKGFEKAKLVAGGTIILDALKGFLPILLAMLLGFPEPVLWAMAFLVVVGHCYSVYLLFEGGKGVATAFGATLILLPIEALLGLIIWFLVAKYTKISSLSSLLGLLGALGASYILHPNLEATHTPFVLMAFIVVYKHIPNIIRLFSGKEKALVV